MKKKDFDTKFQWSLIVLAAAPIALSAIDGGAYLAGKNGVYILVAALAMYSVRYRIARVLGITIEDE